jgi:DNA processing protein
VIPLLGLDDEELVAAVAGRRRDEFRRRRQAFDPELARGGAARRGLELVCRCSPAYPARLRGLAAPPAVLHIAGGSARLMEAAEGEAVAIVGSRRASAYGIAVARSLARGLAASGVPVISGMAVGIDAAAHGGALVVAGRPAAGRTLAVLAGGADRPYPRANRGLFRRLREEGVVLAELAPGTPPRSWMFRARNRVIAALASMTVVVEAGERSGSLVTADFARELGRPRGAVPGQVTSSLAAGPNQLLREGAHLVRGAQDVLDVLFETGARAAVIDDRPELDREQRAVLAAIADGHDTPAALARRGILPDRGLATLASLELAGYIRRGAGGRFARLP